MNINSIANRIGMDYDSVLEDYCGDVSVVSSKLKSFLTDCDFLSLQESIKIKDEEGIKEKAHKIKKLSEKLGILPLYKAASLLENAKANKIESAFSVLENEYNKVEEVLKEI